MRLILFLFCVNLVVFQGYGKRIKDKIYVDVSDSGRAGCFRRLNATHQIGCTSDPKGNVGIVHYIDTSQDIDWLINYGPHEPYAVLLKAEDFNMDVVGRLRSKINGIMVIHEEDEEGRVVSPIPATFSPDRSCPNNQYGLYADSAEYNNCEKVTWNTAGQGLMFEDLSIPVFVLTQTDKIKFIIDECYVKFNKPLADVARDYPLCAVQLKDRMDGAKDSETCIRRNRNQKNLNPSKYCDPMGDNNIYATVKNLNHSTPRPDKSVILAAARMDSFSMFDGVYPSADNQVSGIVALLAAAEAIGKVQDKIRQSDKDIMFTFFQGESFDYIGSSRMVYDMSRDNFPDRHGDYMQPINLTHIDSIVEVNQLAYRDEGKLWIHTDPISRPKLPKISEMIKMLKELDGTLVDDVKVAESLPLPPASVQSFLKKRDDIPAVVITDHHKEYTNKYYNSRFDLASKVKADYPKSLNRSDWYDHVTEQATNLTTVATLIARYLYLAATGDNSTDHIVADDKTVTHLLYCYLISPKCELLKESLDSDNAGKLKDKPFSFYVGVEASDNEYSYMTKILMLRFLGDKVDLSEEKCKNEDTLHRRTYMQGPLNENGTRDSFCIQGSANYSLATSPAFEIDDYDYASNEFPAWTESSWQGDAMNVRFFLLPSKSFEVTTLVAGIVILVISLVMGYFLDRKSAILFSSNGSPNGPVSL